MIKVTSVLIGILFFTGTGFSQTSSNAKDRANTRVKERLWMKKMARRDFDGMPYRLIEPIQIEVTKKYPLILYLHGMGGRGKDNQKQLRNFIEPFTADALRKKHPHFFVAPQTPHIWTDPKTKGKALSLEEIARTLDPRHRKVEKVKQIFFDNPSGELPKALSLVDTIIKTYPVDTRRIYIIGHSMGGFGTWNALWLRPDFFAAAIPSAGALFPNYDRKKIAHVPIWAFHGDKDTVVDYLWGQNVYKEMKAVHANMKFTTLLGIEHGAAGYAFGWAGDSTKGKTAFASDKCDKTDHAMDWLFRQRK